MNSVVFSVLRRMFCIVSNVICCDIVHNVVLYKILIQYLGCERNNVLFNNVVLCECGYGAGR